MTDRPIHPATAEILRFFDYDIEYDFLPREHAQIGIVCKALAHTMAETLSGPEVTVGLRKLLEAKDCFTRAALSTLDDGATS